MPEEIASYFEKKYSELKEKSKTYGDLEKLIDGTFREVGYANPNWRAFVYKQLKAMLHEECGSLPIIR